MLEIQLESGERLWLSVYAIKTVKAGTAAGTALVTWTDGSYAIVKSEASELVKRIRVELSALNRG